MWRSLQVVANQLVCQVDDVWRAAIVGRQVHPSQPGQPCCEVEDPSDVGQPPGVDRLVVVTDEEDVASLPGKQQRQFQLGPVQVLRAMSCIGPAVASPIGVARRRTAPGASCSTLSDPR